MSEQTKTEALPKHLRPAECLDVRGCYSAMRIGPGCPVCRVLCSLKIAAQQSPDRWVDVVHRCAAQGYPLMVRGKRNE